MTAPDLTSGPSKPYPVNDRTGADDEVWLSELQRIEDEPDAPESLRFRVALAMAAVDQGLDEMDEDGWEYYLDAIQQDDFLRLADAALAAVRGES